jgi:hypothetical protein
MFFSSVLLYKAFHTCSASSTGLHETDRKIQLQ